MFLVGSNQYVIVNALNLLKVSYVRLQTCNRATQITYVKVFTTAFSMKLLQSQIKNTYFKAKSEKLSAKFFQITLNILKLPAILLLSPLYASMFWNQLSRQKTNYSRVQ